MPITVNKNTITASTYKELLEVVDSLYDLKISVEDSHYAVNRIKLSGEGYVHVMTTPRGLFDKLNSMGSRINSTKSLLNGSIWLVTFTHNVEELLSDSNQATTEAAAVPELEVTVNEDIEEVEEQDIQENIEEQATEVDSEAAEEVESDSDIDPVVHPDFDYAESLYNEADKAGSKVKLEEYARQFDIELSRGKKFESMLEDFKGSVSEVSEVSS